MVRVIEVKRRLDGSEERFECELVRRTASMVLAVYRFDSPAGPIDSYGCFWANRPYLCYHMVQREDGREWATRFDVVRDMRLDAGPAGDEVRYTDLLLDLWVDAAGPRWDDEDEVEAARASGLLAAADLETIDRARDELARQHRAVAREVQWLAGLE